MVKTDKGKAAPKVKRTTTVTEETRDRESLEAEGREIPLDELEPDVDKVLAQLGEEAAKVYLERRGRRDRRWSMVDTIYADEFSLENVKAQFGGGEYRARIIDRDGEYLKARNFYIEGPERFPEEKTPADAVPSETPLATELLREVLTNLRQPQQVGPVQAQDPMDAAIKIVEVLTTAMAPFLAAFAAKGQQEGSDPWSPFDRGLELGERLGTVLGGKDEGSSTVAALAGEILHVLRDTKKGPAQLGAQDAPAVADDAPAWVKRFAPYIPLVHQFAEQGRQPDLYAALVVDRIDGATAAFLTDQLAGRGAQFVEEVYRYFPATARYRDWYDAMFSELAVILVGATDERLPEDSKPALPDAVETAITPEGES